MPVKAKGKKCDSSSSSTSDSEDDVPTKKKATPVKSAKSKVGSKERKPLAQKASRKHDAKATSSEEEKAPKEKLVCIDCDFRIMLSFSILGRPVEGDVCLHDLHECQAARIQREKPWYVSESEEFRRRNSPLTIRC